MMNTVNYLSSMCDNICMAFANRGTAIVSVLRASTYTSLHKTTFLVQPLLRIS